METEESETKTAMADSTSTEKKTRSESPPDDDCCPICFGSFSVPCRSNCGHWFCGSCILQFWSYSSASNPCKCPMCSCSIVSLMPQAGLQHREEQADVQILKSVQRYNLLFVGGARGFLQKLIESPLFIKRFFCRMMDPDTNESYIAEMRIFADSLAFYNSKTLAMICPSSVVTKTSQHIIHNKRTRSHHLGGHYMSRKKDTMILSALYTATPFDFIPRGGLGTIRMFDYGAIALVLILRLVGIYRRRRLTQRVRHLATAEFS